MDRDQSQLHTLQMHRIASLCSNRRWNIQIRYVLINISEHAWKESWIYWPVFGTSLSSTLTIIVGENDALLIHRIRDWRKKWLCWKILENPKMRNYRKILWWKQQAKALKILINRWVVASFMQCEFWLSTLSFSFVFCVVDGESHHHQWRWRQWRKSWFFSWKALENRKRVTGYEWKIFFWFYRLENKIIFITSLRI